MSLRAWPMETVVVSQLAPRDTQMGGGPAGAGTDWSPPPAHPQLLRAPPLQLEATDGSLGDTEGPLLRG